MIRERIFLRPAFRAVGRARSASRVRMLKGAGFAALVALSLALGAVALGHLAIAVGVHPEPVEAAPDLVPVAATIAPSPASEGDVLRVSVTIENRGGADAWAATITLVDVRPNGDTISIGGNPLSGPLAHGRSTIVPLPPFVAAGVGLHTLIIHVEEVSPGGGDAENDALSVRLAIQPAVVGPPPTPSSEGFRDVTIRDLGTAALLVVVVFAAFFVGLAVLPLRPHDPGPLIPPPPDPPDRRPPPIWPP